MRELIFVTGGSSGIGRAVLEARVGSDVRLVNISRRAAPNSEHVALDLADPASWPQAADLFRKEIESFDGERVVLVHSAGTLTPIGFAGEVPLEAYQTNVLLNSASPQVLGTAFLQALGAGKARGVLLQIGSGAAQHVIEGWSGYCGGKAAMHHWTRTVGAELARRGAPHRVLCVAPGIVDTPMQAEIRESAESAMPDVERFVGIHRDGELRSPEVVARQLWELVDDDSVENGAVLDLRDA